MPRTFVALTAIIIVAAATGVFVQRPGLPNFDPLQYRHIGPPGNRVSAVAGEPGNANVAYVGAASGGVWKTDDGGFRWYPVFDRQPAQSIGALAVSLSDPQIVWAGTGETFIRSNISIGNGVYRSLDAGRTWTHMGLDLTGRVGRIAIHPKNPDVVFAAALGHCYGPQQDRGVYRTLDGGRTWERVLFVNENTGAADLAIDPSNPQVVIAAMWEVDIKTWGRTSGGPGSGLFMTRDGGTTWTRLTGRGLPDPPLGKIAVAFAPSFPTRVYALIETGERGTLWRSDDGGHTWRVVNHSRLLNERPHYYTRLVVSPSDHNEVYFPSNGMSVSYDGGETTESIRWGGDNHDMWADPLNADRWMIGNDLGVMITTTHGRSWGSWRLPIGQIYHVATDTRIPYFVYGQMQDFSSVRGPSNSLSGGIPSGLWTTAAGCETGWATPDPVDPNIVWGGCYSSTLEVHDLRTRHSRSVNPWPERPMGRPAKLAKYRMNWTFPLAISPHDHNTVYIGSQYVLRTTDRGQTWTEISPDLTLNDQARLGDSGGLTLDNLSVEYYSVIFSLAESPIEKGLIWVGTNDGQVQLTRDGGANWANVTANIPGLPPQGTVSSVEPSRHARGTCYIAVDLHQVDNRDPWIYRTTDYGRTWTHIVTGIPKTVFSYAHVVREDPVRKGLLYAGTENGLFVSFDDGARWQPLQSNLPHAPVHWLTIQEHFNDLVVGTYGRGFWILDDVTPLQQLDAAAVSAPVHLFAPRPAYRFLSVNRTMTAGMDPNTGQNPPYGASLTFHLQAAPKGAADLTIRNAAGTVVRTWRVPATAGLNRTWWDLRHQPTGDVGLRTTPPGNPHVWEEKRFKGLDARPVLYYGIQQAKQGPLVSPGEYTVALRVDGREATRPLVVRKDPNSAGTDAEIRTQEALAVEIRDATNSVVSLINQIEWVRKQLEDFRSMAPAMRIPADLVKAAEQVDAEARAIEDRLVHPTIHEGDAKSFRGPMGLYLELLWLQAEVGSGAGDVSGGADFAPTRAAIEVTRLFQERLATARSDYGTLVSKTVAGFNERLRAQGLSHVIAVSR